MQLLQKDNRIKVLVIENVTMELPRSHEGLNIGSHEGLVIVR